MLHQFTKHRWLALRIILLLGVVGLLFSIWGGPFRSRSVCGVCGKLKYKTKWEIPFTSFNIFDFNSESETPVSATLMKNSIIRDHEHQWLFAHGGGNTITCAIGAAGQIIFAAESQDVARIIELLHKHGEVELRNKVTTNLFNRKSALAIRVLASSEAKVKLLTTASSKTWASNLNTRLDTLLPLPVTK